MTIDGKYYKELGKIPPLADSETRELSCKYRKTGQRIFLDRLIEGNLRLVVKIARAIADGNQNFDDIIAAGNLGLIKAAEKFDPARNVQFNTFASWWIRQTIWSQFRKQEQRPINKRLHSKANKLCNEIKSSGRQPSVDEIAKGIKCSENLAKQLIIDHGMQIIPLHEISPHSFAYDNNNNGIDPQLIMEKLRDIDRLLVNIKMAKERIPINDLTDIIYLKRRELQIIFSETLKKACAIHKMLLNEN